MRIISLLAAVICLTTAQSEAKDLTYRLGIGYSNQTVLDTPGPSVHYYPSKDIGLSAHLGLDTQKDQSRLGVIAKAKKIIFFEERLNFYVGGGLGMLSQEVAGSTSTGFELQTYFGTDFFLPGLDNLSLAFEAGLAVSSISGTVRFRTMGDSPIRAGAVFYF